MISCDLESTKHLTQLRTQKELAEVLGVGISYIAAMKRNGFKMPGGKASILAATEWLNDKNAPEFTVDTRNGS